MIFRTKVELHKKEGTLVNFTIDHEGTRYIGEVILFSSRAKKTILEIDLEKNKLTCTNKTVKILKNTIITIPLLKGE